MRRSAPILAVDRIDRISSLRRGDAGESRVLRTCTSTCANAFGRERLGHARRPPGQMMADRFRLARGSHASAPCIDGARTDYRRFAETQVLLKELKFKIKGSRRKRLTAALFLTTEPQWRRLLPIKMLSTDRIRRPQPARTYFTNLSFGRTGARGGAVRLKGLTLLGSGSSASGAISPLVTSSAQVFASSRRRSI